MPFLTMNQLFEKKQVSVDDIKAKIKILEGDVVCLSGSLVEGHGTFTSDIDAFVLVPEISIQERTRGLGREYGYKGTALFSVKNITVDVEYHSIDEIKSMIERVDKIDSGDKDLNISMTRLSKRYSFSESTSLLHRIYTSIPLVGAEEIEQIKKKMSQGEYFKWISRLKSNAADNVYDDVVGLYEIGEYLSAFLLSKELIAMVAEAFLFSKQVSLDRRKWLTWSLQQLPEKDQGINQQITNALLYSPSTEVSSKHVEKMMDLYENLQMTLE